MQKLLQAEETPVSYKSLNSREHERDSRGGGAKRKPKEPDVDLLRSKPKQRGVQASNVSETLLDAVVARK